MTPMPVPASPALPPPPQAPAGAAPPRAPGSIRRTSTIDVTWPDGRGGPMRLIGRARDLLAAGAGTGSTRVAEGAFDALLTRERMITAISASPDRPMLK